MEQALAQGLQENGQVAWWTLGVMVFAIIAICGFLLGMAYKGVMKRLDALEKILGDISKFLAKQEGKNEIFDAVKIRVDVLEDKVLIIEQEHKNCPVLNKTVGSVIHEKH